MKESNKNFWRKAIKNVFEGKQKIFEWILKERKNIWRKVKKIAGKQKPLKESKAIFNRNFVLIVPLYCSDNIISYKKIRLFEWITIVEEEFIIGVSQNRKGNLGYGDCWKYLAYSTESQVVVFEIQALVVESSFR